MTAESTKAQRRYLTLSLGRVTPHSAIFIAFNCLYFLPVIAAFLFSYTEGGTGTVVDLEPSTLRMIALTYAAGVSAFLLGSRMGNKTAGSAASIRRTRSLRLFDLSISFWLVCLVIVVALLISKVLLIPVGVYSEYAFDTESMTNGVWTFSMFCSESLVLLSLAALFSTYRHNVLCFVSLSVINAVNLMHGTRIFFMVAAVAFLFYGYLRRKLTWRVGLVAMVSALAIGYAVFLMRSNLEVDSGALSLVKIVSPVMYESIFSQLALFEVIRNPHLWSALGSPHNFFLDAAYFLVPRFLLPNKDQMLYMDRFADLSPLGAFSGYAQGLIYFGLLFPIFYFVLGIISSWLLRKAQNDSFWSVVYVYVVCDILFRVMRDGYIIPIKMLIDGLAILGLVRLCDQGFIFLSPVDSPNGQSNVIAIPNGNEGAIHG